MKAKLSQIFDAHPAIEFLAQQYFTITHVKNMADLIDSLNDHYSYIAEKQTSLLEFYGTKNEEGKYDVPDDKKPFYEEELSEFLNQEVELKWNPIPIEDLGATVKLPIQAYKLIEFLFLEEAKSA